MRSNQPESVNQAFRTPDVKEVVASRSKNTRKGFLTEKCTPHYPSLKLESLRRR
jgi:hypothetical protein